MTPDEQTAIEAAAWRTLVGHLQKRTDVQNIDLMNMAGFCRNCMSRWMANAAGNQGVDKVLDEIEKYFSWLSGEEDRLRTTRAAKIERRVRVLLNRALLEGAWSEAGIEDRLAKQIDRIAAREVSPYRWVETILQEWIGGREE